MNDDRTRDATMEIWHSTLDIIRHTQDYDTFGCVWDITYGNNGIVASVDRSIWAAVMDVTK